MKRKYLQLPVILPSTEASRKGAISIADQGVVSVTTFITGVIIGRTCSKEEFGLFLLGFTIISFVIDIQTSLLASPYMVYSPRMKGIEHAQYTGSILIHQLFLCGLTIGILTLGILLVSIGFGPKGLESILLTLIFVITFILIRDILRRILFANFMMITAFLFDVFISIIQVGSLLVLTRYLLISAVNAYWVIGISCAIAIIGWLAMNWGTFIFNLDIALRFLIRNWAFGKWVFASGFLWTTCMSIYPWMLTYFHGTPSVAVFSACLSLVSVCNPAVIGIQNYLGPQIASTYAQKGVIGLRRFILKVGFLFPGFIFILSLILLIYGDQAVELIYGRGYGGNITIVRVMVLNLIVSAIGFSYARGLFAIERADIDFKINFINLGILLILGPLLVGYLGPIGAALCILLSNSATSFTRLLLFKRMTKPSLKGAV